VKTRSGFTLACMLVLCAGLSAQPPRPPQGMGPKGPGFPLMLNNLDLTEVQRKSIHAILEKRREAQMTLHQAAIAKEKALMDAMLDPSVTEAWLRKLHADAGDLRLQALLEEHAVLLEIQAVLTPEQRAKAKDLQEKMKKEMESHRAAMEALGACPGGPGAPPLP